MPAALRQMPAMDDLAVVAIPGGCFAMGSSEDERQRQIGKPLIDRHGLQDEGPSHQVTLSAFACMRRPVTRRLYAAVTGDDPLQRYFEFAERTGQATDSYLREPDLLPVVWVRWLDAIRFCNALSQSQGLAPCYSIRGEDDPGSGQLAAVEWDRSSDGYRLPTEAEWEYACRAGTSTQWSHGDDEAELGRYAWYDDARQIDAAWLRANAARRIQAVGQKLPNPWGLFDMHGNVAEWCYDAPREYSAISECNPVGDSESNRRSLRGGSTASLAHAVRSAARNAIVRKKLGVGIGFRCVRGVV